VRLISNPKIIYFGKSDFYNDKLFDIVWVNHSHSEKQINPWKDIKHTKDKNKIYVDLFHDPINGCSSDSGFKFEKSSYRNVKDFKGDLVLMGDIHKQQYFRKNKTVAYSSSLIQQNYGETVANHGFLIWNIESKNKISSDFITIDNDHTFINLHINEGEDYDNLTLNTNERIGTTPEFKIHWKDLSSVINNDNERKIRNFIKKKYDSTKVKFDKTYVYTDMVSSKMLSETLDLANISVQRKIFQEYLEEQGYKKVDIEEILNIDDIVNDRLELKEQKTNIEWKIDKFWFDNFRVFGDDNEIIWSDLNGIIQIHGKNQQGKTTILDAITYILYGSTATTDKREKYGDNRYINNKRNLDGCSGGAVLDIDGEKITILRKTERKWNKNKTDLTSCSTTLDYYTSDIIKESNKLTGERKTKTQEKLDTILGNFKDFTRISLTNADNLNELLSADRSTFIDSIIRDAGYDIFEKKLKEYKEYKKNLNLERLVIDVGESENEINLIESEITDKKTEINDKKITINEIEKDLSKQNVNRDNLIKKLNKIDESMVNFDVDLSQDTLLNYFNKIKDNRTQITIYDSEIKELPIKFEATKLDDLKIKLKNTNVEISKLKEEITVVNSGNVGIETKSDKVKQKLRELRDIEISKFKDKINNKEKEIANVKNKKQNIINSKIFLVKDDLKIVELEKVNLENKIKSIKKDGAIFKSRNDEKLVEIEEFKNSKFCPACGRDYDESTPDHLEHIQQKIESLEADIKLNNIKIKDLIDEYKVLNPNINILTQNITELTIKRDSLLDGKYDSETKLDLKNLKSTRNLKDDIIKIDSLIDRLKNNDLSVNEELKSKFDKGKMLLKKLDNDKNNNLLVIKNLDNELTSLDIDSIEDDIYLEEKVKDKYESRKEKINLKEKLNLNIDNFKMKIKEIEQHVDLFEKYKDEIRENLDTQSEIEKINADIFIIAEGIRINLKIISDVEKNIILDEKEIKDISLKIEKFVKQKKKEELMKEYQRCISRDGIPTYLLKKSIHLINKELNDLLTNVDFTLFFNEDLILKLSMDDRLDVSQNAIESSGKERTFCALALKIALRQINIKSRPNFIILDEIMGKLYEKSVIEFIELLDEIKNKIDKIIIIEHVHPINYDGLITVQKDDDLTSSLITDF
jgi:DNA repair exonuclease SbcCD ATPase subunit